MSNEKLVELLIEAQGERSYWESVINSCGIWGVDKARANYEKWNAKVEAISWELGRETNS